MISKFFAKSDEQPTSIRVLTDDETAEVSGGGTRSTYFSYYSGSSARYSKN